MYLCNDCYQPTNKAQLVVVILFHSEQSVKGPQKCSYQKRVRYIQIFVGNMVLPDSLTVRLLDQKFRINQIQSHMMHLRP